MPRTASKKVIPSTLASSHGAPTRPSKIRPSKAGKWRALVLILVHVLIGLHIAHWLTTGETVTPVEPSEAMAFSRDSVVNAGLVFFAAMILLTAVFGRFFCGWGCHLVALQDFCRHLMMKIGITPRPFKSRALMWVPTLAFLYMFIWPAVYRWWIGDSFAVRGVELTTSQFWATFPGVVVGILTLLVCGFACVYFLGAKGFCTYACPYGAIFAAADRVAPMRIRVTDACEQCGHCTAVCSSNVRVHEEVRDWGMVVSPGCMKCQDCVSVCPKGALYYGIGPIPMLATRRTDPSSRAPKAPRWADEMLLVAVFVVTFLIVRGLYGLVPFLMSLGLAGVMAFLVLTLTRVLRQPSVEQPGLRLKRAGKLLPQGKFFLAAMALILAMLAHSAIVQVNSYLGQSSYERLYGLRQSLLAAPGVATSLPEWAAEEVERADDHLRRAEAWSPLVSFGHAARMAWIKVLGGDQAQAAQFAAQALERGELSEQMHQLLAHLALLRGDSKLAIEQWRQAIEQRPDLPEPYLALGLHIARSGQFFAAQEIFDDGTVAVPFSAELFYNAALARAMAGNMADAVPLFERALELDPNNLPARENLAGVLASLGDFDSSVKHFRIAVEQAPNDVDTRILLSRALFGSGSSEEAAEQLREVLARNPDHAEAKALLDSLSGG